MNTEIRELTVDDSAIRTLSGERLDLVAGGNPLGDIGRWLTSVLIWAVLDKMLQDGTLRAH